MIEQDLLYLQIDYFTHTYIHTYIHTYTHISHTYTHTQRLFFEKKSYGEKKFSVNFISVFPVFTLFPFFHSQMENIREKLELQTKSKFVSSEDFYNLVKNEVVSSKVANLVSTYIDICYMCSMIVTFTQLNTFYFTNFFVTIH